MAKYRGGTDASENHALRVTVRCISTLYTSMHDQSREQGRTTMIFFSA